MTSPYHCAIGHYRLHFAIGHCRLHFTIGHYRLHFPKATTAYISSVPLPPTSPQPHLALTGSRADDGIVQETRRLCQGVFKCAANFLEAQLIVHWQCPAPRKSLVRGMCLPQRDTLGRGQQAGKALLKVLRACVVLWFCRTDFGLELERAQQGKKGGQCTANCLHTCQSTIFSDRY